MAHAGDAKSSNPANYKASMRVLALPGCCNPACQVDWESGAAWGKGSQQRQAGAGCSPNICGLGNLGQRRRFE
jgi:hypothetical protein